MAEKRLVDMMGGAASVPKVVASSEVNYFWKKFDFTSERTFNQVLNEHPYCKNPIASTSKLAIFKSVDQFFLLFHLGDAYFFMNELVKT